MNSHGIPEPIQVTTTWIDREGNPRKDTRLLTDLLALLAEIYEEGGTLKIIAAVK